eukprot:7472616-Karenia_brevis.AAC.1
MTTMMTMMMMMIVMMMIMMTMIMMIMMIMMMVMMMMTTMTMMILVMMIMMITTMMIMMMMMMILMGWGYGLWPWAVAAHARSMERPTRHNVSEAGGTCEALAEQVMSASCFMERALAFARCKVLGPMTTVKQRVC